MATSLYLGNLADTEREIVRRSPDSLYRFLTMAWAEIDPSPFVDNWHLPIVCERLQAVSSGEVKRLVINVPPGTTKSLTVSVAWPAWEWISRPSTKWMFASYDASLVGTVQGGRVIDLLQSKWFIDRWGELLVDKAPAASMFQTAAGGFRFATSPGGKGTGRHVDIQVVDDPNKPQEVGGTHAVTKKAINAVSRWYHATAASRRADPANFRRVIVMQRLHEDDLAGEMLREGGWDHLCLPMRKTHKVCVCHRDCTPEDQRTEEGELLWPERFPEEVVRELETTEMGPAVAAAQLQQRPTPASGGMFQKAWFRYWHHKAGVRPPQEDEFPCVQDFCKVLPRNGTWLQSWDMTFKGGDGTDYVAGGLWLKVGVDHFLVKQVCRRMSFTETVREVKAMTEAEPRALTKLIEDKANGPAVEDTLKREISGIVLVNPEGGKEARANAVTGLFEAGNVFIPHPDLAPWVQDYRTQLVTFPRGVNDDMVDQTTQALIRLHVRSSPLAEAMRAIKASSNG